MLERFSSWVDEIKPIDQPQRFGNKAFKKWKNKLDEVSTDMKQFCLWLFFLLFFLQNSTMRVCVRVCVHACVHCLCECVRVCINMSSAVYWKTNKGVKRM